mmetsp:Transcript_14516/g.26317  ORF Transcript_14516/g.26317 Transcript_14516/m.26317 type:complete len:144 (+) Transcript_14516:155-586(+)
MKYLGWKVYIKCFNHTTPHLKLNTFLLQDIPTSSCLILTCISPSPAKKTATDFLSKHALHAGAATEVVYSGEFFFDQCSRRATETGKTALVIDNNSGTFGPPKEKLDLLKLLMQLNFGTDMPILALDREDPLLRELSDANGVE